MNAKQRRALQRIAPVLRGIVQMDVNSYTNLVGSHIGEITDAPTLRELKAIEYFCAAFEIEFKSWRDLCRAEVARFDRRPKKENKNDAT